RRRPGDLGRREGVRPRPYARSLRPRGLLAGEVRRPRLGPPAGAVVVPVRAAGGRRLPGDGRRALPAGARREGRGGVAPPARADAPGQAVPAPMSELSHVDESGTVRMVDVGAKPLSRRRAVARATVTMAPETAARLRGLPKGDAL